MTKASAIFAGPRYYDECLGPPLLEPFAAELARRVPERPPGELLEIACGTGRVTRRLRERLDPSVRIVATDLSATMLDYARAQLAACDGIEWREADAMRLPFADGVFGAVVCGFGMMFVPDRAAALAEARRALVRGGTLAFSVWDRIERNPHALVNSRVVEALFPGDPEITFRLPYEMHDPALLRRLLAGAGFGGIRVDTMRIAVERADPRSIATGQVRGTPRSGLIEKRGIPLERVIDQVSDALTRAGGDPYFGQAQALIVRAQAA